MTTALVGLVGVVVGALLASWLALVRERAARRFALAEKQLAEFYSPMVGLRAEIHAFSALRPKLQALANEEWRKLADGASPEKAQEIDKARWPAFAAILEYDNEKFERDLLPLYRQMVTLFREKYWLCEPDTRQHYATLVEYVEVWERFFRNALPVEVIRSLHHTEEKLHPFYDHLQAQLDLMRRQLKSGNLSKSEETMSNGTNASVETMKATTNLFLVPSSILVAALGVAATEWLKTGVSVLGFLAAVLWIVAFFSEKPTGALAWILGFLAFFFCLGWAVSGTVHAVNVCENRRVSIYLPEDLSKFSQEDVNSILRAYVANQATKVTNPH